MAEDHFDQLLTTLRTGRWNYIYFASLCIVGFLTPFHFLEGIFVAPQVGHNCTRYSAGPDAATIAGLAITHRNHSNVRWDECQVEVGSGVADLERGEYPCVEWEYDTSTFTSTLTSEFDLVCGRAYLQATYQSSFQMGTLLGSVFNGLLADRLGRRTVVWAAMVVFTVCSFASAWVPGLHSVLNLRLVLGIVEAPLIQTGFNLAMEVCEPRLRSVAGILMALPWAFGTVAWGGLAYFIRDWRWLQVAISVPALLAFPIMWLQDESPRWLIMRGRFDQAEKVIMRAARLNGATLPQQPQLRAMMEKMYQESVTSAEHNVGLREKVTRTLRSFLVLYRSPKLRCVMLVVYVVFFVCALVFLGISLSGASYSDDPFLYMALSGLAEVPAYTLTVPFVMRFGRRLPSSALFFLCGSAIIALAFIPLELSWLVNTLAQLGKFSISAVYQIIYLYGTELIPTDVRLQGFATAAFISKLGDVGAPFITQFLGALYPAAPSLVFGVAAFVAALATLYLPETLGVDLPDTVPDLEKLLANKNARRVGRPKRDGLASEPMMQTKHLSL